MTDERVIHSSENIETRQLIERQIFSRLEIYSRRHLTSKSRLRRRLKSDVIAYVRRLQSKIVSESLVRQWFDEILDQIYGQMKDLPAFIDSSRQLREFFLREEFLFTVHSNTQWRQRQLTRARVLCPLAGDILPAYERFCRDSLTPKPTEESRPRTKIDLDVQYAQAENSGRDYLTKLFADYERRGLPRVHLIEEMIGHGLEQMIKRPRIEDFHRLTNIGWQLAFILRNRHSYTMNLQNVADDFMVSVCVCV